MTTTMKPLEGDSLQTPLLLASDDARCEEQTVSRVLVTEDEHPVSTTEHSVAITIDTTDDCHEAPNDTSAVVTTNAFLAGNLRFSSSCGKDVAFAVSGVATIVAIAFVCLTAQELAYVAKCAGYNCDDEDSDAGLLVFLCCVSFLFVWMVFRIWKAYFMEEDYKKALIFGIFICLTFFGLVLLGPVGAIVGLVLAVIICCIIVKDWPPLEDDSSN